MNARRPLPSSLEKAKPGPSLLTAVAGSVFLCIALAGCSSVPTTPSKTAKSEVDPKLGVAPSPRVIQVGEAVPKGGGRKMVGKPYTVAGKRYVPRLDPDYRNVGLASWYGDAFHGRYTANGEIYDANALTAAHPTMPLPSYARVTSMTTGRSIMVRVNDRGPYHGNRIMDVSRRTAEMLGIRRAGIAKVKVEYVSAAPRDGDDSSFLLASYQGPAPGPIGMPETMVASAEPLPGVSAPKAAPSTAPAAPVAAPSYPVVAAALPPIRPAPLAEEAYIMVASLDPADAYYAAGGQPIQVAAAPAAAETIRPTLAGFTVNSFQVGAQPIGFDQGAIQGQPSLQVPLPEAAPPRSSYAAERVDLAYAAVEAVGSGVSLGDLAKSLERASNRTLPDTVVQVGVFGNPENADRVADALAGIGRVAIDDVEVGGKIMKRVRIAALVPGVAVEDAVAAAVQAGAAGARAVR